MSKPGRLMPMPAVTWITAGIVLAVVFVLARAF